MRLIEVAIAAALLARGIQGQEPSEQAILRMATAIQRGVSTLPNYGLFDDISFSFKGYTVTLRGHASRPTLKDSAERVVRKIEGVEKVVNEIEVLPLSGNDDQIRAAVYARIYGHATLSRYNPNRGVPLYLSPTRLAAGITNDPPQGHHPIHILVKNGNVTLRGVVDNIGDKTIAGLQANTAPGAFSVVNEIQVAGERK
jgi:hypothetical protein